MAMNESKGADALRRVAGAGVVGVSVASDSSFLQRKGDMVDDRLLPSKAGISKANLHAFAYCAEPATSLRSSSYRTKLDSGPLLSSEASRSLDIDQAALCSMREKQVVGRV